MEYREIKSAGALKAYVDELKNGGVSSVALDIEGEFNLHAYGERLCLIQVYDGREAVVIDPLEMENEPLKLIFEEEKLLKIMWDASSDISLLVNGYDTTINTVLDLRPAADLLELPKRDYASVLAAELGVETKKKAKFQKYNWLRRPIDPEALEYALGDVLHLPELKDHLIERLYREHMLEEFFRRNLLVQNRDYRRTPGQRHKKLKGYRYLKKREKELLKRLFNLRDRHARRLDLPPHNVIANPDLLQLSRRAVRPDRLNFARRMKPQDREQILSEVEAELKRKDE